MTEKNKACAKCGAEKKVEGAYVTGYDTSGICAAVEEDAKNVFKKPIVSEIEIDLCGACGYIEFFAAEPEKLYRAMLAAKAKTNPKKSNVFKI